MTILVCAQPNLLPAILSRRFAALFGEECVVRVCSSRIAIYRAIAEGRADAYIVYEHLGRTSFSAEDFAYLGDMATGTLYPVISSAHKGDGFVRTLFANHILGAIFETGDAQAVAETFLPLLRTPRKPAYARLYYGLEGGVR